MHSALGIKLHYNNVRVADFEQSLSVFWYLRDSIGGCQARADGGCIDMQCRSVAWHNACFDRVTEDMLSIYCGIVNT
jgi:hypothetical protein